MGLVWGEVGATRLLVKGLHRDAEIACALDNQYLRATG